MRMITSSLVMVLLCLAFPANAERKLVVEEDGIRVEEELGAEERILPIMVGTTTMSAKPMQIAAWIQATHTHASWMHNCEEARVIRESKGGVVGYNRIASPWPVSDRDVVLVSSREDLADGSIHIKFRNTTDDAMPPNKDSVRMRHLFGSYLLTPVEDGTQVIYTVDSDPGGSLPGWLVRQASKELPLNTLRKLRERAQLGMPPAP
ncbi:MAG: hypothetical protein ACI9QQ_000768 [Myxococcota bacterium]|jgi:hypothetical protein